LNTGKEGKAVVTQMPTRNACYVVKLLRLKTHAAEVKMLRGKHEREVLKQWQNLEKPHTATPENTTET
jgi:metal-sulfur cluster biosynthetic enzyme